MDTPTEQIESPMDGDDIAYPCKGCGEVRGLGDELPPLERGPAGY
jgi:hypothetical protein